MDLDGLGAAGPPRTLRNEVSKFLATVSAA